MSRYIEIIAEIGINHNGAMAYAYEMIDLAKEAGADVAKFQLYDPEILLDRKLFSDQDWKAILASKLTYDQAFSLKTRCDNVGIEFMASCFNRERFMWLEKLGVKRHKIASRSIFDDDLVSWIQGTGKPYLVSLGHVALWYRSRGNGPKACRVALGEGSHDVKFLYCVSQYPTPLKDVVFPFFDQKTYHGFSDHTMGLLAAKAAIVKGATIIEKHLTLDRNLPGPDQKGSMLPQELFELCTFRNHVERFLETSQKPL